MTIDKAQAAVPTAPAAGSGGGTGMPGDLTSLKETIEVLLREHRPQGDSFFFNGGTVLALAATIGATSLSWTGNLVWLPRALSALAAFLIGLERALSFGERWRYHLRYQASYRSLKMRVALAEALTGPPRDAMLSKVVDDLEALLKSEGNVPMGEIPKA
jgi:hypothetical protein